MLIPADEAAASPAAGSILYQSSAPRFSTMLHEAKVLNRQALGDKYKDEILAIVDSLDAVHSLAAIHAWALANWVDAIPHPANQVLFSCFHKSLLSLHAAHELTLDGLYGIARPHLRQAFESMMIAKLCATDPDSDLFDKWIDGMDFYFTNGVLRKISRPGINQFSETWRHLCQWSHATVFAAQISLDLESTKNESGINLALIGSFLNFQDHLLNQHILTPTVKYYAKRYGDEQQISEQKNKLKSALRTLNLILGPSSRLLVKNFRSKWQLK